MIKSLSAKGMIVVLGSPNSDDGVLYSIAKERCELALVEFARRPHWKLLLTGGYGEHFNRTDKLHASYVKAYLVERGIPSQAIVEFAESTNTLQDASLSKPIVLKYRVPEIVVVTSDYHLDRARFIFEREFADTEVHIEFSISQTVEEACEFDMKAQKKHEREALAKLREIEREPVSRNRRLLA
jgi:uncharacterized SAM-binding protein YcdF (DUF218 family)